MTKELNIAVALHGDEWGGAFQQELVESFKRQMEPHFNQAWLQGDQIPARSVRKVESAVMRWAKFQYGLTIVMTAEKLRGVDYAYLLHVRQLHASGPMWPLPLMDAEYSAVSRWPAAA